MQKVRLLTFIFILFVGISFPREVMVIVPKGSTASSIAKNLKEMGIIKSEAFFWLKVKLMKLEFNFPYGNYMIDPDVSVKDIILQLHDRKRLVAVKVTIPEGYNLYKIDKLLSEAGITTENEFYSYATNPKNYMHLIKDIPYLNKGESIQRLEGLLFPDTYLFEYDTSIEEIIKIMINNFNKRVIPVYLQAQKNKTLPKRLGKVMSFYNLITLASLVESEAVVDSERAIIASVYINRLNKRMILAACPTVLYSRLLKGLPWKETLYYKDLKIESDYNTYKHIGLPPSPISNPGLKSIIAAMSPEKTPYYYFVSKRDKTHQFSKTEREHINWSKKLSKLDKK